MIRAQRFGVVDKEGNMKASLGLWEDEAIAKKFGINSKWTMLMLTSSMDTKTFPNTMMIGVLPEGGQIFAMLSPQKRAFATLRITTDGHVSLTVEKDGKKRTIEP